MADQKPGKVIRVSKKLWSLLQEKRRKRETNDAVLRRLIGLEDKKGNPPEAKVFFALPSDLAESAAEARGRAVLASVRKKKPVAERPIAVREVV